MRFTLQYICWIILPVVLYGCELPSLTLKGEQRLQVFVNRALRGMFALIKVKQKQAKGNCTIGSFKSCISLERPSQGS
jgi:hypothetical protein